MSKFLGKQLFLPRDREEIQDVFNIFYKTVLPDESDPILGEPKPSYQYFEDNGYTELKKRPSAWIRYTDQGSYESYSMIYLYRITYKVILSIRFLEAEHCWLSDDQCNGGMKWTQWAYRWKSRISVGYYPRGQILQNSNLDTAGVSNLGTISGIK